MANKARGFITIDLGGRTADVALGLGALAELEDAFGVESFEDAMNFGDKMSAGKLLKFVLAIIAGNGVQLTGDELDFIRSMQVSEFMTFINSLMAASGMTQAKATEESTDARPLGEKRAGKRG